MYRNVLLFILLWIFSLQGVFAGIQYTKPTKAEIDSAAKACMEKGKSTDETKYICPEGSFQSGNGKVLSQQVVTCSVKMSLTFSSIDAAAKKWMAELQKQRDPDANIWTNNIQTTLNSKDGLYDAYRSVCQVTNWTVGDNPQELPCARTSDILPEYTCEKLAYQKAEAWRNAGYILMAKGIAKNAQNEKDVVIDEKKTKYSELVNKWNSYKRIVANAVAKFTAYTKKPVQGQ